MSSFHYRPEIDGLRAVAVLGVVLYHVGLGFPGGYVGVDVFFVISGFLITGIIIKDLKKGTFSMLDFWVRRIRRIMPAVTVMVIVCLIAGYVLLSPDAFKGLAKSSIAQSLMGANVYFLRDTGYFAESSEFKPLLHTWSLAVEEQFYVFFPLVLFVFWKWRKHYVVPALSILGAFSLLLSCIGVVYYPQATFFLLPSRAWEMLAGGLLAVAVRKKDVSQRSSEFIAWTGLGMITYAMLFYSHATIFPGWAAILPVLGSVLFIGANNGPMTSAGRLLSARPMVFIGLISYSLYLWHWPLLAFARSVIIDINLPWKLALLAGSIILAVISWRFVETPFRKKTVLATKVSAFSFGAVSTGGLLFLSVFIWKMNGIPDRGNDQIKVLMADIDWAGYEYSSDGESMVYIGVMPDTQTLRHSDTQIDFALWGDSHGMAVASTVDHCAKNQGLRGVAYVSSLGPPVVGLWPARESGKRHEIVKKRNKFILESILKRKIKNVILVCRWTAACDGSNVGAVVVDKVESNPNSEDARFVLRKHLKATLRRLTESGVKVWILKQMPEIVDLHTAQHVYMVKRYPQINVMSEYSKIKEGFDLKQKKVNCIIDDLSDDHVIVIDFRETPNQNLEQIKIYDERSYYRDNNHLTRYGVDHYLSNPLSLVLKNIKN